MGSFSIWHWLIVLLVVVLIFGTKKLRNIGGDVGGAVKSFKDAVADEKAAANATTTTNTLKDDSKPLLIESEVVAVPTPKTAVKKKAPAKATAAKKPAATKAKADAPAKATAAKKPAAKKPAVAKKPAATKAKTAKA